MNANDLITYLLKLYSINRSDDDHNIHLFNRIAESKRMHDNFVRLNEEATKMHAKINEISKEKTKALSTSKFYELMIQDLKTSPELSIDTKNQNDQIFDKYKECFK